MDISSIEQRFSELANKSFKLATGCDVEASLQFTSSALTRYANNTIIQNVAVDTGTFAIRLQQGAKTCKVSASLYCTDAELARTIESALQILPFVPDNAELPQMFAGEKFQPNDRFDHATAEISPEKRAEIVELTVSKCREHGYSAAGIVENAGMFVGLANSNGLFATSANTNARFSLTVEGDAGTGWAEEAAWRFDDIDFQAAIEDAISICAKNQHAEDAIPGKYTVVLSPAAFGDLLMFLIYSGFNAKRHLEGRTCLAGKLNQQIFSPMLSITDDFQHEAWSGLPFDFDGYQRTRVELVKNGVFNGLVSDSVTAEKLGMANTGHSVGQPNQYGAFASNVVVDAGERSMEQLISGVKRGLYVVQFHYTNISEPSALTVTGMSRDGLFLIEDGKVTRPIKNMRFTQSLLESFAKIAGLSSERKLISGFFFGGAYVPGAVIEDFNFSSATEFAG